MKNFKKLVLIFIVLASFQLQAQDKKVAVVSFSTNKVIGVSDLELNDLKILADKIFDLQNDPNFNLSPVLEKYHTAFFDKYSKNFPFQLLAEENVINNQAYIDFQPKFPDTDTSVNGIINYDGYKYIYEGIIGKYNEEGMAKLFSNEADGVLFTNIYFGLVKGFGIGSNATVKMRAFVRIALYDKTGKKVWVINEAENSKKTTVMVKGIPVLDPKKITPMCESALDELMKDLDKRLKKITKKSKSL